MFNLKLSLRRRRQLWAYAFIFIPLLFFITIRIAPTFYAFNVSLHEWNPLSAERPFVGLDNFRKIAQEIQERDSVTRKAFQNTFIYVALGVPTQLTIGLFIAMMLNRINKLRGLFRALYVIPFVTSTVAISWVWRWLYLPTFGPLNLLLDTFGLPEQPFLQSPKQALPCIAAVTVWQGLGYVVIIFLAGLQQIPEEYYDAAKVDGASGWRLFRHITIPLLNPTIVYLAVLQSIRFLRMFAQVMNMTEQARGGPLNSTITVVLQLYKAAFRSFKMGYASALTVVLFVIIMLITLIQLRVLTRKFEY
jgi:multiple sugar transport system permease protein